MSHAARPEDRPGTLTAREAVRAALTHDRERYLAIIRGRAGGSLSVSDSEEILHGALERALIRADQVQDPTKAAAWVGRVVRNAVVDELRKRRYLTLPFEELELPQLDDDEAAGPDCLCVLVQADQLKAEYGEILRRDGIETTSWEPEAAFRAALEPGGTFHWYVLGDDHGRPLPSPLATVEIARPGTSGGIVR